VGNGRYPSLAISNPTNTATNLSDIYIFFTFPILDPSAFGSFISGFITADATTPAVTDVLSHDINGVRWSTSARTVFSNSGTTAITIGEMDDNSFGVRRFDLDAGTETTFVPASLSYTNFAGPDPTTGGGVITGLDKDQNGGIYVGLTATTTSDTNNYYLQVAKSTDDGVTWSALEMAPISLWQNYMRGLGANLDSSFLSFRSGFAVTGVDEYSFVAQALESNEDNQNNVRQLVEIYKKAGQWGIRKIADISGLSFLFDSDGSGTRAVSQLGNELQLSRTPDRSKLLVKYQDLISYTSNNDLNGDGQTPDTLFNTSDIFVNARDISSSTWSDQQNVTETLFLDRLSWIAPLVPNDLKDIPLLTVQGGFTDDQTTDSARIYAAQFVLVGPTQFVAISNFEAATTSGVREDAAVAASALKIFPNPATSQARASFSLPVAGQVSVRIHDVTGNEIFSLPAQQMTAGTHSVPFNTESLANGAYYYTVTVNGTVSSAMFTVVR
jgi:hypothetical protein